MSKMDMRAMTLEAEIRKLKMELLRQELDDRLLNLKFLLEKQREQNETMHRNNMTASSNQTENASALRFGGSVLSVNVVGDLEVWHFVLLALFIWVLMILIVNCVRRRIHLHYYKQKQLLKRIQASRRSINNTSRITDDRYTSSRIIREPVIESNNNNELVLSTCNLTQNEYTIEKTLPAEPYVAPRGEFLLYTIDEHEMLTKKILNAKQKISDTYRTSRSKLSKSDTNLAMIGFN